MVLLIIICASACFLLFLFWAILFIGVGFSARWVSTLIFAAGRSYNDVVKNDIDTYHFLFKPFIKATVDKKKRTVTSKALFGTAKRKALYREGLGSTLIVKTSADILLKQAEGITLPEGSKAPADAPWPEGNSLERNISENIPPEALSRFIENHFRQNNDDPHLKHRSIMVIQGGRIIDYGFAPGYDENTLLPGWSMTKSLMNALFGILVKEGKISLSDRDLFPEWRKDSRRNISIDDLLRMRSGLKFVEKYVPLDDVTRMLFASHCAGIMALNKKQTAEPGKVFNYSSGTSNILSYIIYQKVGGSLKEYHRFVRERLFNPIGMTSAFLEPDSSGVYVASSYMMASALDWARWAQFYLNSGSWKGEQILPEDWVKESIQPREPKDPYGRHMWILYPPPGVEDQKMVSLFERAFAMRGANGQYITFFPVIDTAVIRLGWTTRHLFDEKGFLRSFVDILA